MIMTTTNKIDTTLPLETLAILCLGSLDLKLQYLKKPRLSDATRLAFLNDTDSWVRSAAVSNAKSDATRLAFKDDSDFYVRAAAVSNAKSDATRLLFMSDANPGVRCAAVSGVQSITILQLALKREKESDIQSVIKDRIKVIGGNQAQGMAVV